MSAKGEGGRGKAENEPHIIRLRGPWVTEEGQRVKLPAVWREALADADAATLTRSFNRPTNLNEPAVSVFLRVASEQSVVSIRLNGSGLADGSEIVGLLKPSNRLVIDLTAQDVDAAVLESWLEITELER